MISDDSLFAADHWSPPQERPDEPKAVCNCAYHTSLDLSERARQYLEELESLLAWLNMTIDGLKAPQQRDNAVLLLMLGAMYRRAYAIVGELRGGSVEGLRAAARSMVETFINALYISKDPTLIKARTGAFLADGIKARKKMAEAQLELSRQEAHSQAEVNRIKEAIGDREKELKALEAEYGGPKSLHWMNLKDRAMKAGALPLYAISYGQFSQDVHVSLPYLERFVDTSIQELTLSLKPDEDMVESILSKVYVDLVGMTNTCNERIHFIDVSAVVEFDAIAQKMMDEDRADQ
jgi:hypothetical protein